MPSQTKKDKLNEKSAVPSRKMKLKQYIQILETSSIMGEPNVALNASRAKLGAQNAQLLSPAESRRNIRWGTHTMHH